MRETLADAVRDYDRTLDHGDMKGISTKFARVRRGLMLRGAVMQQTAFRCDGRLYWLNSRGTVVGLSVCPDDGSIRSQCQRIPFLQLQHLRSAN